MSTVRDILLNRNLTLHACEKIVIYGNRLFNSPVDCAEPDEWSENDYAIVIMPKNMPAPKSLQQIRSGNYRLVIL
jgi:hypothetical protein